MQDPDGTFPRRGHEPITLPDTREFRDGLGNLWSGSMNVEVRRKRGHQIDGVGGCRRRGRGRAAPDDEGGDQCADPTRGLHDEIPPTVTRDRPDAKPFVAVVLRQFASPYFVARAPGMLNVREVRLASLAPSRLVWLATCHSTRLTHFRRPVGV